MRKLVRHPPFHDVHFLKTGVAVDDDALGDHVLLDHCGKFWILKGENTVVLGDEVDASLAEIGEDRCELTANHPGTDDHQRVWKIPQ